MNNPVDEFCLTLRQVRKKKGITQIELAQKLGLNHRTIMDAEALKSNPKFETVAALAKELNISLDAVVFPDSLSPNAVPKCVVDFFQGISEAEAQQFIAICENIRAIQSKK